VPCEKYIATVQCKGSSFYECVSKIKDNLEKIKEQAANEIGEKTNFVVSK
jgi:primosomal protein N''